MTPTPLARWLDTVTAPFPPDTARRIRRELEDHALAHADALREAGHPDPEGAALAALGSATQVQHALMQAHFTRAEEDELHANHLYRKAGGWSLIRTLTETVFLLVLPFLARLLPGWDHDLVAWAYVVYVLWALLSTALRWSLVRRFPERSARVLLSVWSFVFSVGLILTLQLVWHGSTSEFLFVASGTLLGAGVVQMSMGWSLWKHLPKALRGAR